MIVIEQPNADQTTEIEVVLDRKMSDAAFERFCQKNKDLRIERDKNGKVIVMPPVHSDTGRKANSVSSFIFMWNWQNGEPGIVFNSNAGFTLPNGAMRCADAAWIEKSRWQALSEKQKDSFAPLVPDFVVEVRSSSDRLPKVEEKLDEWMDSAVRLGWLIDLKNEQVFIYRAGEEREIVFGLDKSLSGEDVLNGFELPLRVLA